MQNSPLHSIIAIAALAAFVNVAKGDNPTPVNPNGPWSATDGVSNNYFFYVYSSTSQAGVVTTTIMARLLWGHTEVSSPGPNTLYQLTPTSTVDANIGHPVQGSAVLMAYVDGTNENHYYADVLLSENGAVYMTTPPNLPYSTNPSEVSLQYLAFQLVTISTATR